MTSEKQPALNKVDTILRNATMLRNMYFRAYGHNTIANSEQRNSFYRPSLNGTVTCDYYKVDIYLMTSGARAKIISEYRTQPLLRAAATGFPQSVRKLLRHGMDVDIQDGIQRTALHLAVSCDYMEIVYILLKHKAKLDIEDLHGYTPLCEAVWRKSTSMVQALIKAGATVSDHHCLLHYSVLGKHFDITKLLLSAGANPNFRDGNGDTPLLIAASTHDTVLAKLLLNNGALPDYSNHLTGMTPLHILVSSHCNKEDYSTSFEAFVDLLIKHEVDLNVNSPVVGTALTKCLVTGKYRSAEYLIQMGADVNKVPHMVLLPFSNLKLPLTSMRYPLVKLMVAAGYDLVNRSPELQLPQNKQDVDLNNPQGWLLKTKFTPRSLTDICRIQIRKDLGSRVSTVVPNLHLPKTLQRFLMLKGIANEKNLNSIPFYEWY